MSPVAELAFVKQQNANQLEEFRKILAQSAKRNFKLQQEVTGGMQVIYYLASQCPDRTLTIKAADLIAAMGSLQRKHDPETDVYHFIALPPTPEQVDEVQKHVEATNAAHDVPPVPLGQDMPTAAELGQAAFGD
jgi:hypothetical protein